MTGATAKWKCASHDLLSRKAGNTEQTQIMAAADIECLVRGSGVVGLAIAHAGLATIVAVAASLEKGAGHTSEFDYQDFSRKDSSRCRPPSNTNGVRL